MSRRYFPVESIHECFQEVFRFVFKLKPFQCIWIRIRLKYVFVFLFRLHSSCIPSIPALTALPFARQHSGGRPNVLQHLILLPSQITHPQHPLHNHISVFLLLCTRYNCGLSYLYHLYYLLYLSPLHLSSWMCRSCNLHPLHWSLLLSLSHCYSSQIPNLFLPHSHCVHSSCVSKLSVWTSRGWSNLRALTWTTHWLENKINERCECTSLAPRPCITPKPQIWAHIVKQVRAYTPTFNKAFMEVVGISMASCMTLVIPWQSLCAVNMKKPSWWPS